MPRYRHWRNLGVGGQTVFVTTTILDFVEVFKDKRCAYALVEELFRAHRGADAVLHGFVVMSHHVHFLTRLPMDIDVSTFVRRFKSVSSRRIRPMLAEAVEREFDHQRGLNDRVFWQRSFRSVIVDKEKFFFQKLAYIHSNPVKAELCAAPRDYQWSSAEMFERDEWNDETGLMTASWNPPRQAVEG
jgi:REP element-mobilizing transposase RayT